jgi:hypothetical protein
MYQQVTNNVDEVVIDKIRCETTKVKLPPSLEHHPGSMSTTALYPAGTAPVKAESVQSVVAPLFR